MSKYNKDNKCCGPTQPTRNTQISITKTIQAEMRVLAEASDIAFDNGAQMRYKELEAQLLKEIDTKIKYHETQLAAGNTGNHLTQLHEMLELKDEVKR